MNDAVKCRVCGAGMLAEHAASHAQAHLESGFDGELPESAWMPNEADKDPISNARYLLAVQRTELEAQVIELCRVIKEQQDRAEKAEAEVERLRLINEIQKGLIPKGDGGKPGSVMALNEPEQEASGAHVHQWSGYGHCYGCDAEQPRLACGPACSEMHLDVRARDAMTTIDLPWTVPGGVQ